MIMRKMIQKKHIITIAVLSVLMIIAMVVLYILRTKSIIKFDYYYISALVGAIFLFIGWVIPNHFEFDYRKKHRLYKGDLPDDLKHKKFNIRFPYMVSGLIFILISSIFSMI